MLRLDKYVKYIEICRTNTYNVINVIIYREAAPDTAAASRLYFELRYKVKKGEFVISLDLELMWGVQERTIGIYGQNVLGGRKAIPEILKMFKERSIHCTWATVGLLFSDKYEDILSNLPNKKPEYCKKTLSTYKYFYRLGKNEQEDSYHYAGSLIREIAHCANQEIGSHTFSHYYCQEDGQTKEDFDRDIEMAVKAANKFGLDTVSLVLPRNQININYMDVLIRNGITSYRGTETGWMNSSSKRCEETFFKRLFRFADAYINLSGHNCYAPEDMKVSEGLLNIRAGRFLRPYSKKLRFLEGLKIWRIRSQMRYAAKNGMIFHLWWHPHNFGANTEKNLQNLNKILDYYDILNRKYGFESKNMCELSKEVVKA